MTSALALLAAACAIGAVSRAQTYIHEFLHPRIVIHYHPKTSQFRLSELQVALEKTVNAVELDVHLRESDHQVVCNHDSPTAESPTLIEAIDLIIKRKGTAATVNGDGQQFFVVLEPKENSPRLFHPIASVIKRYEPFLSTAVGPNHGPRGITVVVTGSYPRQFYSSFQPKIINRLCLAETHDYAGEIRNLSRRAANVNWISIRHSKTAGADAKRIAALHSGTEKETPGRFNVRIWDCHRDLAIGLAAGADSLNCDLEEIEPFRKMLPDTKY